MIENTGKNLANQFQLFPNHVPPPPRKKLLKSFPQLCHPILISKNVPLFKVVNKWIKERKLSEEREEKKAEQDKAGEIYI